MKYIGDINKEGVARLPMAFFNNIEEMMPREVAYVVANALLGDVFKAEDLQSLVDGWLTDSVELKKLANNLYVYEPLTGPTLSEYDMIGRLSALLVKLMQDKGLVDKESVIFSNSKSDSTAAISNAFVNVLGVSPVMFMSASVLSDLEKRQISNVVPKNCLHAVKCSETMLEELCMRVLENDNNVIMISDSNIASVIARIFMYFDIYRLLKLECGDTFSMVCAADANNAGVKCAVDLALKLGLPMNVYRLRDCADTNATILNAYNNMGYLFSPRSVAQYATLTEEMKPNETGVVIQQSHPAKFGSMLEPLINRVIPKPHQLCYNDNCHLRYKFIAPTIHAVKNCLI